MMTNWRLSPGQVHSFMSWICYIGPKSCWLRVGLFYEKFEPLTRGLHCVEIRHGQSTPREAGCQNSGASLVNSGLAPLTVLLDWNYVLLVCTKMKLVINTGRRRTPAVGILFRKVI